MCCMLRFNYCTLQSHFVLELLNMQMEGEAHENGGTTAPFQDDLFYFFFFKMIFSIFFFILEEDS